MLVIEITHQCFYFCCTAQREIKMNASIVCVDQTVSLIGELSFNTVQKIQNQSVEMVFPRDVSVVLDLSQVTKVDSAALALCLALEKSIQASNSTVSYKSTPAALLAIAQSVGVESLFSH